MSVLGKKVNKLIAEIKKGNTQAFHNLHEITYNRLTVIALNYLYDRADLEDVLNEAYLRIYRYAGSFDAGKDGYNWICKIVQNVAYSFNSKRNITIPIDKSESIGLFYEIDESVLEYTDLYRAIKTFGKEEQQLLYLKFWLDLSYGEIAVLKGTKKSTVYRQISVLLKKIEKILKNM